MSIKIFFKHVLGIIRCLKHGIERMGCVYIGKGVTIFNNGKITIHRDAVIRPLCGLLTLNENSRITLCQGCELGPRTYISSATEVYIGEYVLTAPNVFIGDHNHEYENISVPIMKQGIKKVTQGKVIIEQGTWLGTNVVVVGNVRIGRNCVIGANSVVIKDIPDYCVAAGNPAKVIKRYDMEIKGWVNVKY